MSARRVLIIGGGAAGMAAAIRAEEKGAEATILERFPRLGKKLLATGNGRCNLCNMGEPIYFGQSDFARSVLSFMPAARVLGVFERWGLSVCMEEDGRVYPSCGQASAVLDVLTARLAERRVRVETGAAVTDLFSAGEGFVARTEDMREFEADACVLATGGLAGGNLGCPLSSYALAQNLGHTLTPLSPALAPLMTERSAVRGLAGLRAPVIVTLMDGTMPVCAAQGEALFAEYGVSGICVMQLARDAYDLTRNGGRAWLRIDFSPMLNICARAFGRVPLERLEDHEPAVRELLKKRALTLKQDELLLGLLPGALYKKLNTAPRDALPALLTKYPVAVQGVRAFENAQITRGGVDAAQIDPETMASRLCPGLYLTGELLNVDGDCGGFNLLFAFATGLLAGESAAGQAV